MNISGKDKVLMLYGCIDASRLNVLRNYQNLKNSSSCGQIVRKEVEQLILINNFGNIITYNQLLSVEHYWKKAILLGACRLS